MRHPRRGAAASGRGRPTGRRTTRGASSSAIWPSSFHARREAERASLDDLDPVVGEAEPGAAERDEEDGEALGVAVAEHQVGDRDRGEDDQPAHRRRPGLLVVALRALLADLLAELAVAKDLDELRPEEDRDQHRRHAADQDLDRGRSPSRPTSPPSDASDAASLAPPPSPAPSSAHERVGDQLEADRARPLISATSPSPSVLGGERRRLGRRRDPLVRRVVAGEVADADQRARPRARGRARRSRSWILGARRARARPCRRGPPRGGRLRASARRRGARARRASRSGWRCSSR